MTLDARLGKKRPIIFCGRMHCRGEFDVDRPVVTKCPICGWLNTVSQKVLVERDDWRASIRERAEQRALKALAGASYE